MTDKVEGQPLQADVLLVTVTEIEARAVVTAFPVARLCHFGELTYHDLGTLAGARVFMVQSEMGSGGPAGSILTIQEANDTLHPTTIIMVGIAFGIDRKKRQPGDILVASQLLPYELQRVGTNTSGELVVTLRADRPSASPRTLSIFRGAVNYWQQPPRVHFGPILSGEKLVDNQAYLDQLLALGPEAIGGEMEGAGLYATAQRKKTDWIIVKAICDWADGSKNHEHKEQYQQDAAANAVGFVRYVLGKGGFAGLHAQSSFSRADYEQPPFQQSAHADQANEPHTFTDEISPVALPRQKRVNKKFDVFLCYNESDRAAIKRIGTMLKERGILPWLDEWELRPGFPWQRALEQQIRTARASAVFVGKNNMGPWHRSEMEALLREFQRRNLPVIPVLLPDAVEGQELPAFLEGMTWVDFRQQEPDPLQALIWGIVGEYEEA